MNSKDQYNQAYKLARSLRFETFTRFNCACIEWGSCCGFEAWESLAQHDNGYDPIGVYYRGFVHDSQMIHLSMWDIDSFRVRMAYQYRQTRKEFAKLAAFETLIRQQKSVEDRILAVLGK